jgi:hypothetical protein
LTDERKNLSFGTGQVVLPVLTGFLLRIRSFNELNNMIKENEFNNILPKGIKLPQIDAIRDALKVVNIKGIREILIHGIMKFQHEGCRKDT